jgi:hypothetical protein
MKRIFQVWLGLCLSALLLVGCGGGDVAGEVAGVGSGGTGGAGGNGNGQPGNTYLAGVITESDGDIVVNGVHIDTQGAAVSDVNAATPTPLTAQALKPGMMVEVDAAKLELRDGKTIAKSVSIRISSQIRGVLLGTQGLDDTPEEQDEYPTLFVLGMQVHLTDRTVFDDSITGGIRGLTAKQAGGLLMLGNVLEVHGFLDPNSGNLIATRISRLTQAPEFFFVHGMVLDLDMIARGFQVAGLPFNWLADGDVPDASSKLTVQIKFRASLLKDILDPAFSLEDLQLSASVSLQVPNMKNATLAYLDGLITSMDLANPNRVWVNNLQVDLSALPNCEACASLREGDRVRVQGSIITETKPNASPVELVRAFNLRVVTALEP